MPSRPGSWLLFCGCASWRGTRDTRCPARCRCTVFRQLACPTPTQGPRKLTNLPSLMGIVTLAPINADLTCAGRSSGPVHVHHQSLHPPLPAARRNKHTFRIMPIQRLPLGPSLGHDSVQSIAHIGPDILHTHTHTHTHLASPPPKQLAHKAEKTRNEPHPNSHSNSTRSSCAG